MNSTLIIPAVTGVTAGIGLAMASPLILPAIGFTAAGISAGSIAASMMSFAAKDWFYRTDWFFGEIHVCISRFETVSLKGYDWKKQRQNKIAR